MGRCGHSSRPQTPEALLARSNSTALTRIGKAAATAELATTSTTISDELVTTARRLVRELMRALRWEARDVLGDELLRDDVIVIDQESG